MPFAQLVKERHSTREFDDARPITLAELARLLDSAARVRAKWSDSLDMDGGGPEITYATRPYPSGGAAYELELYLSVANCEGLARGFYHYDADQHALTPIVVRSQHIHAQVESIKFAIAALAVPQVLNNIAQHLTPCP